MYADMLFPVPAVFLAGQAGAEDGPGMILLWVLCILGVSLIVFSLIVPFLPPERLTIVKEHLKFGWKEINVDISWLAFIFLLGLIGIGFSIYVIYVSEPSRMLATSNQHLVDLNTEKSKLEAKLEEIQQELERAKKVTVTLFLTPPPDVDLSKIETLQCDYVLSDGLEGFTPVGHGIADRDVACRIENIQPDAVVMTIRIETKPQGDGKSNKGKLLAFREYIYPARPHYHLCGSNKASCTEEDSWR